MSSFCLSGLYLAHLVLTGRDAVTDIVWTSPGQVGDNLTGNTWQMRLLRSEQVHRY